MELGFLNGVYYIKSESLLSDDDYNALKRLERSLFFKYLKTKDYGYGSKYDSLDNIISKEMSNVIEELIKNSRETLITDVFFVNHNLTNMKIIYKSINFDLPVNNFDLVGSFSKEALEQFFKYNNDKLISEYARPLFNQISKIKKSDIRQELQEMERLTYDFYEQLIINDKNSKIYKPLYDYFNFQKGLSNLTTFLRLKIRNEDINKLREGLIEENFIGSAVFLEIFEKSNKEIITKLGLYLNTELIDAIENLLNNYELKKFKLAVYKFQKEYIKTLSYDASKVGPIVYFLFLKELETLKVRELYYAK